MLRSFPRTHPSATPITIHPKMPSQIGAPWKQRQVQKKKYKNWLIMRQEIHDTGIKKEYENFGSIFKQN